MSNPSDPIGTPPPEGTNPEANAPPLDSAEANPKKPPIVTIADLISHAYSEEGRKLTVAHKDLLKLVVNPEALDDEKTLVRSLAASDPLLAVPPRILTLVAEQTKLPGKLRHRLLDLMLVALVTHEVFQRHAEALYQPEAEPALTAAQLTLTVKGVQPKSLHLTDATFKPTARARLSANVVSSFTLYRVLRDRWPLERYVAEMQAGLWSKETPENLRDSRTFAILASSREPDALGIISTHLGGLIAAGQQRADEADRRATEQAQRAVIAEDSAAQARARLDHELATSAQLRATITRFEEDLARERDHRVVDRSHFFDDTELLRTQIIRRLTTQIDLLSDGLHAIRNGSHSVAEEFLDRSLTAMTAEVERLKSVDGDSA